LAEQQARETQIQLALERVRARTMAMHKSDELADTVFVLFQQFKELGIEPKMLTIGIMNERERVIEFWVTDWSGSGSKVNRKFKASIEEPILLSKIYACWKEQKKSIEIELSNKELQAWIDYRVKLSEIPDEKDYSTSKGYVVAANFPKGILSISSYEPQTPETVQLLERFAGVFDLTYTRFFDLQKAEAQAKEAKIEASLERVRSKAMAMHTSNDLSDTMGVLFTELPRLGINSLRCGVVLLSRDSRRGVFYAAASTPESDSFTMIGAGDMNEHPIFMKQHEHWLKNENYFTSLSNEELESYYKALFARLSIPYTPREHKVKTEHGYYFAFTEGMFYAWAEEPYSEEEINILNRFKAIIDLTFRRYLDLQKAEAQAREAKIEVSLERVRSKAMAMHSPNDLAETVNVFFKELKTLGIIPIRCGVGQIDEVTRTTSLTTTTSSQQGESFQVIGKVKQTGHPVLDGIFDHWKLQKEYFPALEGEDIKAYYDVMNAQIGYPEYPEGVTQYGNSFPFKEGFVFAWTENKLSEEELQIFRRFTSVLSLTYRRYMDLKEAEAQAREAKIEASLEKVRSKTMAMQSSDELADTAAVVFQQLNNLGIEPNRIYITIIKDETGLCEFWITDEDGTKVSSAFRTNLNENHSFKKMYEGWKQDEKSITIDMHGEELQEYFRHLSKLNVPFKDGLSQKRRMQYIAYFSKGFIGVASPDETKSETIQLLERFAAVFNLTYTRFNDLQQAEAQNKIIQAENERKTKELEEARQLQLAMLPKSIPEIANLDIAVYMKTATEVGGDYYDFKVQENGVLNIGIGDATGHGLQAGTMITLMKGFFTSDVARFSPQKFLEHCNGMIRDIKLGRILMSFSHLRFNDSILLISSAGMPPIYYHHKKNNRTEEIIIQGLPLGAMGSASYKLVEKQLNIGDTILLLTDGLPEQMNSHKVIFDYSRVLKYFDEIAKNNPNDIINCLVQKANEWMDGTAQVDDITFVVIKVK
jgi:coenzyme F420-reducing hydrogenase delta subunit